MPIKKCMHVEMKEEELFYKVTPFFIIISSLNLAGNAFLWLPIIMTYSFNLHLMQWVGVIHWLELGDRIYIPVYWPWLIFQSPYCRIYSRWFRLSNNISLTLYIKTQYSSYYVFGGSQIIGDIEVCTLVGATRPCWL